MSGPGADQRYWDALHEGHVEMQQCGGCGRWNWPAVWRCGECGSWEHHWREVPLSGTIYSWTRTWHDFGTAKELGLPFVSVVVELDGAGKRRLLGTLAQEVPDIRIGAPVVGTIGRVSIGVESIPALRWQMRQGAG